MGHRSQSSWHPYDCTPKTLSSKPSVRDIPTRRRSAYHSAGYDTSGFAGTAVSTPRVRASGNTTWAQVRKRQPPRRPLRRIRRGSSDRNRSLGRGSAAPRRSHPYDDVGAKIQQEACEEGCQGHLSGRDDDPWARAQSSTAAPERTTPASTEA